MIDPFVHLRDVTLSQSTVDVLEVGAGPPVVFLHGNPDSHIVWAGVAERLKDRFRCIAPDLPGYGRSTEQHDCSLAEQAAVIAGVVDALSLDKFHLVVHDVGGTYGLAFVAKHAARLLSLTITNTNFFADYDWHFWAKVWRTPILGEIAMAAGTEGLFVRETTKSAPKLTRDFAVHAWKQYSKKTRRQVLRYYRYMDPARYLGWQDEMKAVVSQLHSQVIWGDLDPFIPKQTAERFGAKQVHHISDLSHWAAAEDPDRVATLIASVAGR